MMFLSAGMVLPIYLSIHSLSINFQHKRDGEMGSEPVVIKPATIVLKHFDRSGNVSL